MSIEQEVDSIIAEENITDATPAAAPDEPIADPVVDPAPVDPTPDPVGSDAPADPTPDPVEPPVDPDPPVVPAPITTPDERSPSETVQEAHGIIKSLDLSEDKIFNDKGEVRPFGELVPAGPYLASQLNAVKVTGKDGKDYEFLVKSDVDKQFPDGFEAKNGLEQRMFEQAIVDNEIAFRKAVDTYKGAETAYTKETSDIVQSRGENERIGNEYKAMAEAGLVPKIEGSPDDPKFLESAAVKELNKILNWMDTENKTNAAKGLGQITSLYVAKQLMDIQANKEVKDEKKGAIISERNEVASLSSSPTPDAGGKKEYRDIPMSRLADEIIASEGLR